MNGEIHVGLDKTDFIAMFPLKGEGRARLVGTVRDDRPQSARPLVMERRRAACNQLDAHQC